MTPAHLKKRTVSLAPAGGAAGPGCDVGTAFESAATVPSATVPHTTLPDATAAGATAVAAGHSTILVVDGDARSNRTVSQTLSAGSVGPAREVLSARTSREALEIAAHQPLSMAVVDLRLADGGAMQLISDLRRLQPELSVVATARTVSVEDAILCMRSGVTDLIPKPFTREQLAERLENALRTQSRLTRHARKIERLRGAVRKLSEARRTVAKKVDLLCNDLVTAYGELSRQVDSVRTQEDFRKLCDRAHDLEQLLCHAMDWIMRRVGYANIAVFLAADDTSAATAFQLGAYVKYTMPSSPELTESIRDGLVARAGREGFVKLSADEANKELSAAELRHLRGQAVVAANCTYLGESLACVVLFRDGASPFTMEDAETFRAIAPILAIALAGQVRGPDTAGEGESGPEGGYRDGSEPGAYDDNLPPNKKPRDDRSDADWWKRGEAPPY